MNSVTLGRERCKVDNALIRHLVFLRHLGGTVNTQAKQMLNLTGFWTTPWRRGKKFSGAQMKFFALNGTTYARGFGHSLLFNPRAILPNVFERS
jgi:hypothetical protein